MTTNETTETKKTVIVLSRGLDDERATIAWTIANGGIAEGADVTVFLVSAGVDLVRRGAADLIQMNPVDPSMKELIDNFMASGGKIVACPPCAKLRGYTQDHLIPGVVVAGTAVLFGLIKDGAATLSF
jgi:predicted peroxiredoxin